MIMVHCSSKPFRSLKEKETLRLSACRGISGGVIWMKTRAVQKVRRNGELLRRTLRYTYQVGRYYVTLTGFSVEGSVVGNLGRWKKSMISTKLPKQQQGDQKASQKKVENTSTTWLNPLHGSIKEACKYRSSLSPASKKSSKQSKPIPVKAKNR